MTVTLNLDRVDVKNFTIPLKPVLLFIGCYGKGLDVDTGFKL